MKTNKPPRTVLSIGMIIKNESRHLRNCLVALQPLMRSVSSELIIADTGSTDESVKIAGEFAAHVLQIPWNNDFSEARNHTLCAARGEWFMYIDADEYMEDAADIINFFKNGSYKRATSASYFIREYLSDDTYTETANCRLFKISPTVKFKGRIHETVPVSSTVMLNSYVRHHGYTDADDPELMKKKTLRNLPILLEQYAENPTDILTLRYLHYSYSKLEDRAKALLYLDKELEILRRDLNNSQLAGHYHARVLFYTHGQSPESHQQAIAAAEEYFSIRTKPSVGALNLYLMMGINYSSLGDHGSAADSYEKAYELHQQYINGNLDVTEIYTLNLPGTSKSSMHTAMENAAGACFMLKDYEKVFTWLDRLSDSEGDVKTIDTFIEDFDAVISNDRNAAKIIQPFFDLYQKVMAGYLSRNKISQNSPSVHQVIHHLHLADKHKNDKETHMKHVKTAMRADSRFVPLITARMRPINPKRG